mgnify:CR=1 FL=1
MAKEESPIHALDFTTKKRRAELGRASAALGTAEDDPNPNPSDGDLDFTTKRPSGLRSSDKRRDNALGTAEGEAEGGDLGFTTKRPSDKKGDKGRTKLGTAEDDNLGLGLGLGRLARTLTEDEDGLGFTTKREKKMPVNKRDHALFEAQQARDP